jgi:hypothetical protein
MQQKGSQASKVTLHAKKQATQNACQAFTSTNKHHGYDGGVSLPITP